MEVVPRHSFNSYTRWWLVTNAWYIEGKCTIDRNFVLSGTGNSNNFVFEEAASKLMLKKHIGIL